jgi:hypothetical protein
MSNSMTGCFTCDTYSFTQKRYLEVISGFTRFKEFNGEKKTATKIEYV